MDFPKYIFLNQYLILVVISVIITILLVRNTIFVNQHVVIKFAIMYGLYSLPFYKLLIYDQFHFEIYTKSFSIALLNFLICAVFFAVLIYSTVILISENFKSHRFRMFNFNRVIDATIIGCGSNRKQKLLFHIRAVVNIFTLFCKAI